MQSAGRKRSEPLGPRHPHLRSAQAPLMLEPEQEQAAVDLDTAQTVYVAPAAPVERRFTAQPSVSSAPNPFRRPSAAAQARESTPVASRLTTTDYGYVVGELKRIFITAAVVVLLLIVVALLKR
jgi:hypothetical protein